MLLSMTGFGRAERTFNDKTITVEVRSLNSKYTDVRFKCSANLREKEMELRRLISERAMRGKLDVNIELVSLQGDDAFGLNTALFRKYYHTLRGLADELGIEQGDYLQAILRIPNVVAAEAGTLDEEEWQAILATVNEALEKLDQFRQAEGAAMEKDLRQNIAAILARLEEVDPYDRGRIEKLRHRIRQNLEEYLGKEQVDANRFEQELIFYLEKFDINEEKVRLAQHCQYFLEQLDKPAKLKGRKLTFIAQEMGREINTLGAKAYSSDIQRLVVQMKEELEKIKEQVANTL